MNNIVSVFMQFTLNSFSSRRLPPVHFAPFALFRGNSSLSLTRQTLVEARFSEYNRRTASSILNAFAETCLDRGLG
jgi:hypothetical protein